MKSTEALQASKDLLAGPAAALLRVRSRARSQIPPSETSLQTDRDIVEQVAIWGVNSIITNTFNIIREHTDRFKASSTGLTLESLHLAPSFAFQAEKAVEVGMCLFQWAAQSKLENAFLSGEEKKFLI